jgi:peptidoglycan/xylan/chitin deacetylase (PgdA/CDA1 family)
VRGHRILTFAAALAAGLPVLAGCATSAPTGVWVAGSGGGPLGAPATAPQWDLPWQPTPSSTASGGGAAGTSGQGAGASGSGPAGTSGGTDPTAGASGTITLPPHPAPLPCPPVRAGYLTATLVTHPRTVALTFDDGPGPWTPQFVALLAKYGVHGTFFMVGERAAAHPELVAQVVAAGDLVGNHTWNHPLHPSLSMLPADQVRREIADGERTLTQLSGNAPCFFRGPGEDHRVAWVQDIAHGYGLTVTDATRTAGDAGNPRNATYDPAWRDLIVTRLTGAGDHPIVLMHDGHADNKVNELSALERLITWYRSRDYVFTDPAGRPIG